MELRSRRKGEKRSLNDRLLQGQLGQLAEVASQIGTGCASRLRARSENQHGRASASKSSRRRSAEYTESANGNAFATNENAFCYVADVRCAARRLRLLKVHCDVSALPYHDVKDQPLIFLKFCEPCSWEAQTRVVRCVSIMCT